MITLRYKRPNPNRLSASIPGRLPISLQSTIRNGSNIPKIYPVGKQHNKSHVETSIIVTSIFRKISLCTFSILCFLAIKNPISTSISQVPLKMKKYHSYKA